MLVDGPVKPAPFAADLDGGLINPGRSTLRLAKLAKTLLDHRRVGQYPPVDGAVINLEAALFKHFFHISIARRISQIPGDACTIRHYSKCLPLKSSSD